jgi:hypothetical protein
MLRSIDENPADHLHIHKCRMCLYVKNEEENFFCLCETFRSRGLLHDNAGVSVEEQVATFLHVVGHNQRFRVVHQSFRRFIETIHRHFH